MQKRLWWDNAQTSKRCRVSSPEIWNFSVWFRKERRTNFVQVIFPYLTIRS